MLDELIRLEQVAENRFESAQGDSQPHELSDLLMN